MTIKHANPILDDLWAAMGKLYDARYRISDAGFPQGDFDHQTFSEIAGLQSTLQTTLTRLENKAKENK